jgi:hypothetical protein
MKRTHLVIATVGTWVDPATGRKVKRTLPVGALYESTGGKLVLRVDAIPTSPDWSGWMQVTPCAPDLPAGRRTSRGMPPAPPPATDGDNPDEDVPF